MPASPPLPLPPGIIDGRGRFRAIWRAVAHARLGLPDERHERLALRRFAGEVSDDRPVALKPPPRPSRVLVVPGIYGACVAWLARPLEDALGHVRTLGWATGFIPVEPRSGSARNGRLILAHLHRLKPEPGERAVLVGYSKGLTDIMEAAATPPGLPEWVAAVVGVGGAVLGSPLADGLPSRLKRILDRLALPGCPPGDGGGLESLRRPVREAWLARHGLPESVRWFSLAAVPEEARLSRLLIPSYRQLARIDPLNDSQVVFRDALVPGGTLLGVVNADHWAMALPIARNPGFVARGLASTLIDRNAFPREVLLEAILRYVDEVLTAT